MNGQLGAWSETARRLLQKLRHPDTLELDTTGVVLRDALGTATVYDAVLTCAERALAHADERLATIVRRCDVGGETMKTVADDLHVSLRHFFRFRAVVVEAVAAELARVMTARVPVPRDPGRADAVRAVALAQFLLARLAPNDDVRALEAAESALRSDATLSTAWCAVAGANVCLALRSAIDTEVAFAHAEAALDRAGELAPRSGVVHGLRSVLALWHHRDAVRARGHAEVALDSAAGRPRGHSTLGWIAVLDGAFDEAERQFASAAAADPSVWSYHLCGMAAVYLRGDYKRCADRCAELHAVEKHDSYVLGYYGDALNAIGRYEKTIEVVGRAPADAKTFSSATALARAHVLVGDDATAASIARGFHGPAVSIAALALTIGDTDRAWRALARARDEHNGMLELIDYDPIFEPIRHEPRFAKLVQAS